MIKSIRICKLQILPHFTPCTITRDTISDAALFIKWPLDLPGLPDEHGRVQILNIHTAKIRENKKLAQDVDIDELAAETKNFSGAEIEGLIRAATSTAMNRLIKVSQCHMD